MHRFLKRFFFFLLASGMAELAVPEQSHAGDILRGGGGNSVAGRKATDARAQAGAEAAELAKAKAVDRLARTSRVVNAMRQMQAAARSAATGSVPDGLTPGGLKVLTGSDARWTGANAPVQSGKTVTVTQTAQQALLHWETFNIGKNTSLYFNQKAGGNDSGKWTVFNKVFDPSGQPSKIQGSIKADGQVYVINRNGIVFGPGSQVNTRTFVASSLPINDNLVERGLLNQEAGKAFEFLFSSTTPTGNVVVESGAVLSTPVSNDGNGGRIMLVGENVRNSGTISTPSGQTILAAGRQVGIDSHRKLSAKVSDPGLRGIDVYVGEVGTGGTTTNNGIIEVSRGSALLTGKTINQFGIIESSTSVSLNGRIDLLANYGATPNASYQPSTFVDDVTPFLLHSTGTVSLGGGSLLRILPETWNAETTVGTELALRSTINIQGRNIHFGPGSTLLAPNAKVALQAGTWASPSANLARFIRSRGQVYLDSGALLDVSGTTGVSAPLSHLILSLELRGSELANSPLQRNSLLRALTLTVDLRKSGTYGGWDWVGTPLGDVSGYADLIERNVGELTTEGGTVTISAGESFVQREGASIDISGGWMRFEEGWIQTTRLWENGHLVDIAKATPDRVYNGIYTGTTSAIHDKWGLIKTYAVPLSPSGEYFQKSDIHGADAGHLIVKAPAMALEGELLATTVAGPRQLRETSTTSNMPAGGSLILSFRAQDASAQFRDTYPTSPTVIFQKKTGSGSLADFSLDATGTAGPLDAEHVARVIIDPEIFSETRGFDSLTINNEEGTIQVSSDVGLTLPAQGSLSLTAALIRIGGSIIAPGGTLEFKALNISPYDAALAKALNVAPTARPGLGIFTLEEGTLLSTAGRVLDDRNPSPGKLLPFAPDGGSISISGYDVNLEKGTTLDVSGGFSMPVNGKRFYEGGEGYKVFSDYGDAGSILVHAGQDPNEGYVTGGSLTLGSTLRGLAGGKGGSLSLQAPRIQIGGTSADTRVLLLQTDFFDTGGFSSFTLSGLGSPSGTSGEFLPAVWIVPGTRIEPVAKSLRVFPNASRGLELVAVDRPVGDRSAVSLSFLAPGVKDFDGTSTLIRGDLVMGEGSLIRTDPGASVTFQGNTAAILGSIFVPGGSISISGGKNSLSIFPPDFTQALTTVYIGPRSVLSTTGTFVQTPDSYGRLRGAVLPGGNISVSGNIVAAAGAILDVSGFSAVLDLHPTEVSLSSIATIPKSSGVTSPRYSLEIVPTRVDSDGGTITLTGGQMLFSDATLLGAAGGPTALGGTLVVSSGRFYPDPNSPIPTLDSNLVVTQGGRTIPVPLPESADAIGRAVRGAGNAPLIGRGYITANTFLNGGFDSLELQGSVEFSGPVHIEARRELWVADGGILRADSNVRLTAPYVAIGKPFQSPVRSEDLTNPFGSPVAPSHGNGSLTIAARWIDVGTLSLQGIGQAEFSAYGGDIRGMGTLDIAGDLTLRAAQIYPASASRFTIVAYDYGTGTGNQTGSVTILGSGTRQLPLSAGGSLAVYASTIEQKGVLRTPLGSITLGWDGTGTAPVDLVVGNAAPLPVTSHLTLASGSVTSVSAIDPLTGKGVLIPYGVSTDGENWIDPTGTDISSGGLIAKNITLSGTNVTTASGSVIDLRGGGDIYAYQWINGTGGTMDLLGTASEEWNASTTYQAGDLVLFSDGQTYSARKSISPEDFAESGIPDPTQGRYWTKVPQAFAILPWFTGDVAPYAPFNSTSRIVNDTETNLLFQAGAGAGYVSRDLKIGDKIYLAGSASLSAGYYTLLPARYALLPGAVLVTSKAGTGLGALEMPEGTSIVSGYRFNALNSSPTLFSGQTSRFEILTSSVLRNRAEYQDYLANDFLAGRAVDLNVAIPELPGDSANALIQATQAMALHGTILSRSLSGGRGAGLDLSSTRDFVITANGASGGSGVITLDAAVLNGFGVESLLIGGVRSITSSGTSVKVNTDGITLASGATLSAPEIILVANNSISLAPGAALLSTGSMTGDHLLLNGNGTLLRVSGDPNATITRSAVTTATSPLLTIGAGASLLGSGITLDSSSSTALDPTATLLADAYHLNSGRISLLLDNPGSILPTTGLVLDQSAIRNFQAAGALSLLSYSSLDIYGTGLVGSAALSSLALHAGEIRGFNQSGGIALFQARDILIANSPATSGPGAVTAASGSLAFEAETIRLGVNNVAVDQFLNLAFTASKSFSGEGTGGLSTQGTLDVSSPLITATAGAKRILSSTGAIHLSSPSGPAEISAAKGLGATYSISGFSINADTSILLPSGSLSLQAVGGDLTVSGWLDVSGTKQFFYDASKYTDGGEIHLSSSTGNVIISSSGRVNVSAHSNGGNAGTLAISAAQGSFVQSGSILGKAGTGGNAGAFDLDVLSLPSLASLNSTLTTAGLLGTQNFRVRSGDVSIDGTVKAHSFTLSADLGSITVSGTIDASGATGGTVSLSANGSVILENNSLITVAAEDFSNAGKGGSVSLEAGAQRNGVAGSGVVDIQTGSRIDLSVASKIAGDTLTAGSSASEGKFSGTLHIRAPQNASHTDLLVNPINGTIVDASSILVEGYRLYDLTSSGGSTITSALQTTILNDGKTFLGTAGTTTAGYTAMLNRLLANNSGLESVFVLAPGAEIINRSGSLTLGTTSSTSTSDWNLSTFRFGAKSAAGVLTLRASGDLVFYNTLSDGFSPTLANTNTSWLWLAQPTLLAGSSLPVNTQSWSYRFTSGSDFSAANFRDVASTGSVRIGKDGGTNSVSGGNNALTATAVAKWYQVIRTGSGDIDINAGGNIRLLNQLATVYTAGTRVTNPTLGGQFDVPSLSNVVGDEGNLGIDQQTYPARYTMAGGDITLSAKGNIERLTLNSANQLVADSTRQLPNNWLLRRGYVDPDTGEFGTGRFNDTTSTTWWINFSNFFQGVGALGGGDVTLTAAGDISNVDAVIPTNARMTKGTPDAGNLLELGGGDLTVSAGNNIDAGVYYVERGTGTLSAGGSIVTNQTRSPSTTNLTNSNSIENSQTWLPTTLFVGKGGFDVSAKGNVLLGPTGNAFLLPQGLTNSYWYKTYFSTYSPESFLHVSSLGGTLSLRTEAVIDGTVPLPLLRIWAGRQQLLKSTSASFYQPWLRLSEDKVSPFNTITSIMPSSLLATAFSGDITLSGDLTLFPSATGTIELAASGGISGLQPTGFQAGSSLWTASTINLSDSDPSSMRGVASPYAYQTLAGTSSSLAVSTGADDFLQFIADLFSESGATAGLELSTQKTQARHTPGLLHANDPSPARIYAQGGDISGLTLFSPKKTQIFAAQDISDIAFYIQNSSKDDTSIVASGRDIRPYNASSLLRQSAKGTGNRESSPPLAGDIQISGPGTLEVLAGRNLDLGTGTEAEDGTGVGITSTGNIRNPFLSTEGADLVIGAGIGFSRGLAQGSLDFDSFLSSLESGIGKKYLAELHADVDFSGELTSETAQVALQVFYLMLRDAGRDYSKDPSTGYAMGFAAVDSLFGRVSGKGDILTRERDIRTKKGGSIHIFAPGGSLKLAKASSGARLAPPGIITESGGNISIFTDGNVDIGDGRIFVLRGGNQIIWSSNGDIAAGKSAKTVQSARPTQVTLDPQTASVETDLAGLATGGGIGVLATVKGIDAGDVDLIAPKGTVDAGDAGIRATGNLNIAATQVLNADNIAAGGTTSGVPAAPTIAAPNIGGLTSASTSTGAANAAVQSVAQPRHPPEPETQPSFITVEVLGYGGEDDEEASL